jgi:hypothetical protein
MVIQASAQRDLYFEGKARCHWADDFQILVRVEGAGCRLFGYQTGICNKRGMRGMLVERIGICNTFLGQSRGQCRLIRFCEVKLRVNPSVPDNEDESVTAEIKRSDSLRLHLRVEISQRQQAGVRGR